jgi:membrane fusion protein (multidrug efflux system)
MDSTGGFCAGQSRAETGLVLVQHTNDFQRGVLTGKIVDKLILFIGITIVFFITATPFLVQIIGPPSVKFAIKRAGLLFFFFVWVSVTGCKGEKNAEAPPPRPVHVEAVSVKVETLDRVLSAVGSLSSPQETVVAPQIAGKIVFLNIDQGRVVAEGETLARLDDSVQKAAVAAAQASLSNARQILERDKVVVGTGAVSDQKLQSDEFAVKQAEAQLEQAQANLQYTIIRAPFTGILGIRQVSMGAYLKEGDAIVRIDQIDPLHLDFDLPQQYIGELKVGQTARFNVSGLSEHFEGKVTTLDPALSAASRAVRVQATVKNSEQFLKPGMFAMVDLIVGQTPDALFVPMQSIVAEGQIRHVWVVGPENTVLLKKVEVGIYQDNWVQIVEGLAPTDRVVTAGVQKLYPGAKLVVSPYKPIHNPRLDLAAPDPRGRP